MAWTTTPVAQFVVGDRRIHVCDCVYGGTGYGGGINATGATGATGPTKSDLGFAGTADPVFSVLSIAEVPKGATGAFYGRKAVYDPTYEKLVVGATGGTDISDVTYRMTVLGTYQK